MKFRLLGLERDFVVPTGPVPGTSDRQQGSQEKRRAAVADKVVPVTTPPTASEPVPLSVQNESVDDYLLGDESDNVERHDTSPGVTFDIDDLPIGDDVEEFQIGYEGVNTPAELFRIGDEDDGFELGDEYPDIRSINWAERIINDVSSVAWWKQQLGRS